MDPGLEEKGLALLLPPKPLFFPGGCQTTLNHRPTGKQLLEVTHGILLVTAGWPAGCQVGPYRLGVLLAAWLWKDSGVEHQLREVTLDILFKLLLGWPAGLQVGPYHLEPR